MKKLEPYTPLACQFYDVLEMYASRKETVTIAYFEAGDSVKTVRTKIETLVTKNKEEFALFPDGTKVRLDQIIGVNDTQFYGGCSL